MWISKKKEVNHKPEMEYVAILREEMAKAVIFPDNVLFRKIDPGIKAQFLNNHPDKDIISGEKCPVVLYGCENHGGYEWWNGQSVVDGKEWYIVERNGRLETWERKELRIIEPRWKAEKGRKR
jgi:hypothetical protein